MNEDHLAAAGEDEVGFAGEVGAVEAAAVAEAVDERADEQLGPLPLPRTRDMRSLRSTGVRVSIVSPTRDRWNENA